MKTYLVVVCLLVPLSAHAQGEQSDKSKATTTFGLTFEASPGLPAQAGGFNHLEFKLGKVAIENLVMIAAGNKAGTTGEINASDHLRVHFQLTKRLDAFGVLRASGYRNSKFGKAGFAPGAGLRASFNSGRGSTEVYGYATAPDSSPNKSKVFAIGAVLHRPLGRHRFGAFFFAEGGAMNFLQSGTRLTQGIFRSGVGLELGRTHRSGQ
jgi:hypothetical protein